MKRVVEEEIMLDSGEVDIRPVESELRKITGELSQNHAGHGIKKLFRIYDNKILGVGEKSAKNKRTFLVHLALLGNRPKHSFNINGRLLSLALVFFLASCFMFALEYTGMDVLPAAYIYVGIILFAVISIILFYRIVKGMRSSVVFYTAHGQIPLVEIFSRNPDKARYREFISAIKRGISTLKENKRYSGQGILSAEMGEHRRLHEAGVISSRQYEFAKKNILGKH